MALHLVGSECRIRERGLVRVNSHGVSSNTAAGLSGLSGVMVRHGFRFGIGNFAALLKSMWLAFERPGLQDVAGAPMVELSSTLSDKPRPRREWSEQESSGGYENLSNHQGEC